MLLVITNRCNRDCPYCFEGAFRDGPLQEMTTDDVARILSWKDQGLTEPSTEPFSLMGGEPTLNPELIAIVDCLLQHDPRVRVLTNLVCEESILDDLLKREVRLLVNVDQGDDGLSACDRVFRDNLQYLCKNTRYPSLRFSVTCVIDKPEKNFDFLLDILRQDQEHRISALRPAIVSPGFDFQNQFPHSLDRSYGAALRALVEACHNVRPDMGIYGECALNGCWIDDNDYQALMPLMQRLRPACMDPNPDILPDFSSHWCFACRGIPELRIDHVFDFANYPAMLAELYRRRERFKQTERTSCRPATCRRTRFCEGLCPALTWFDNKVESLVPVLEESGETAALASRLSGPCFCGSGLQFVDCHGSGLAPEGG